MMLESLPLPEGKQREVLYLPETGHSVVLGTAGSGKTTLALYRAAYLSANDLPHSGKTLLLTFNRTLVTYLHHLKSTELQNVVIENYHKFARGYLHTRGKMGYNSICETAEKRDLIDNAVSNVHQRLGQHPLFNRTADFFVDEINWIQEHGLVDGREKYIQVERIGRRGTRLARQFRDVMFEIYKEYRQLREMEGKLYDWEDIAYCVHQAFLEDKGKRYYRHIILDEGQDFSPEMIRSLACAIPEDGSLTFFGDVAQQIYGQRTSWKSAGLKVFPVWEFKRNYRNTKQIAQLGLAISRMPYFAEIEDIVEAISPRADGPRPALVKCQSRTQQLEEAVRVAQGASKTQTIAILFKNREQEKHIRPRLPSDAKRLHREMTSWDPRSSIYYGTYHSAKGLEFDLVILPFLDADNLPDAEWVAAQGKEEALTYFGRLIYVAITRAKTDLLLLYTGTVTPLLPDNPTLYDKQNTV